MEKGSKRPKSEPDFKEDVMMKIISKLSWLAVVSIMSVTSTFAAPLSLETTPLFTTSSAKPNLILGIDDSGSMDFEVLFPTNDGSLWWDSTNQRFASAGVLNDVTNLRYVYLFPNGYGVGARRAYTGIHALPPITSFAFARSSVYNKMYYDPDVTYEPWADYGTTTFGNITATAAPADPATGTGITLNLLQDHYVANTNANRHYNFRVLNGMVIPAGTYYNGSVLGSDLSITANAYAGIRYYPATYYTKQTSGAYSVGGMAGDCASPNASHYDLLTASPSSLTGVADSLGPDGTCLKKVELRAASTPPTYPRASTRKDCLTNSNTCTFTEETQNFANWYSYYRKRHIALRSGMGQAFVGFSAIRTGLVTINDAYYNPSSDVTMWDMSTSSNSFYSTLYNIDGRQAGTPTRQTLDYIGKQFQRTNSGAPITESCQKNFGLLFTDGFALIDGSIPTPGNTDSGLGTPYQDSYSNTMADIAMKYYQTNLRTDLTAGDVPPALGCNVTPASSVDPQLDCNTNLHMNTYTVGLGAVGTIFNQTHFKVSDAYASTPTWPNVTADRDLKQVDDLYHAAVNGRGEIFNAESASDLQTQLKTALLGIQASIGSSSAVTFNTSTLETNSSLYFASFNSANWSGDLISFPLLSNGNIDLNQDWSAANEIDSVTAISRKIITYNGSVGVPFRWGNTSKPLSAAQQNDLNTAVNGLSGGDLLNFIRGDRSNEAPGKFRVRGSALGDIVSSNPVFVGVPSLGWPATAPFPSTVGSRYSDFRAGLLSTPRDEVVYVGANDGMLHGFDATSGAERIAYVPNYLSSTATTSGLHYLADPLYSHNYYVDLAPTVSDVYINTGAGTQWHSVLIGGSRAGGRGLFALDITNPSTFTEANAADIALWEFTDPDLGYTYSKPTIAMVGNGISPSSGKWAAIFGNGYNDTGTGEAQLFIVYLEGGLDGTWSLGTDYVKITTGVGSAVTPNGLATPVLVDTNRDGVTDRAYAGDLRGNLWAFDLTNNTVAYSDGTNPRPLFVAKDASNNIQPITSKPTVAFHPDSPSGSHDPDLLIFFGTGKYLEISDLTNTSQQTFYGVWDNGNSISTSPANRTDLVAQTIDTSSGSFTDSDGNPLRLVSDNAVNYNSKLGWYLDLPESGERVVIEPLIRGSLVFFNTWIPSSSACDSGGTGYLMSLEILNGGEPDSVAFNIDGVEGITDSDYITDSNGVQRAAGGQRFDNGLPARSSFLSNKQYTPGTGDSVILVREVQQISGPAGRFSWKEIR